MTILVESLSDVHRLLHSVSELASGFLLKCRSREGRSWSTTRFFFLYIREREILSMRQVVDDTSLLILRGLLTREIDPMSSEKCERFSFIFEFYIFPSYFREFDREIYARSRYLRFDLP